MNESINQNANRNSRCGNHRSDNEKLTSRFGNDYVNQNDHRESNLYNRFHQRNQEIIFCVIRRIF
ncbi:MAG: hypothetical protein ACI8YQ_001871 [Polaribacter sp.]|jgi:hypothetical protein